jgi:tRNA (cytosine38-C5)-methyltransferase
MEAAIQDSSDNFSSNHRKDVKMVEFFSGIGGMRYGIEQALQILDKSGGIKISGCQAYEISIYANNTYACNFVDDVMRVSNSKECNFCVHTKLVEQLKPSDLEGKADLWTMSPPCQPFTTTRNAKQRDSDDQRCRGFKAIIELLRQIKDRPRWIIVENVKGFVGSDMLSLWQMCLKECGYSFEEYLLSPTQLGIPNHRTRYYMICELSDRFSSCHRSADDPTLSKLPGIILGQNDCICNETHPISRYLKDDELPKEDLDALLIADSVFEKDWSKDLPIVSPMDCATHCFTAAYGRQIHRATGSLLLMDPTRTTSVAEMAIDRSDMRKYVGKLRRFSPYELLGIFGFPNTFKFPDEISLEHRFKLIGNSVNVTVIAHVASFLLKNVNDETL